MDFIDLASRCAPSVHPTTLAAIVQHESAFNPYAIGINSKRLSLRRQPTNKLEAIEISNFLKEQGVDFDSGLGQVNAKNLSWLNLTSRDLFDPCKNIKASAKVLTDCYRRATLRYEDGQKALHAALSCYNTGNFNQGISNGYVGKVLAKTKIIVPAIVTQESKSSEITSLKTDSKKNFEKKDAFKTKNKPDAFQLNRKFL